MARWARRDEAEAPARRQRSDSRARARRATPRARCDRVSLRAPVDVSRVASGRKIFSPARKDHRAADVPTRSPRTFCRSEAPRRGAARGARRRSCARARTCCRATNAANHARGRARVDVDTPSCTEKVTADTIESAPVFGGSRARSHHFPRRFFCESNQKKLADWSPCKYKSRLGRDFRRITHFVSTWCIFTSRVWKTTRVGEGRARVKRRRALLR